MSEKSYDKETHDDERDTADEFQKQEDGIPGTIKNFLMV